MKAWLASVLAVLLLAVRGLAAEGVPAELVGIWATEKSEFKGPGVVKGLAIYLSTNGMAAIVVAPPPLGQKGTATYNAKEHVITVATTEGAKPTGKFEFDYDGKAKTLTSRKHEFGKEPFKRRSEKDPKKIIERL